MPDRECETNLYTMNKLLSQDNEIDLFMLIKNCLGFLWRYKIMVALFLIGGALIGLYRIKSDPDTYVNYSQSSFYIECSFISDEAMHTIVSNLNFVFDKFDKKEYNQEIIKSVKEFTPVKELSIDGLRSDIRVIVDHRTPVNHTELMGFTAKYIASTDYYKRRYTMENERLNKITGLINSQMDSLGIDVEVSDLDAKLAQLSKNNPVNYMAYVNLIEKKQKLDEEITLLQKSIEFLPVNPANKPIDTMRLKILAIVGYSLLLFVAGISILAIFDTIKRIKGRLS